MASAYRCICGTVNRTNIFEGHDVQLLTNENYFLRKDNLPADELEELITEILQTAEKVVICINCERLSVIDNDYKIRFYEPIKSRKSSGRSKTKQVTDKTARALTAQEKHFASMLEPYPRLEVFWTIKDHRYLHTHPTEAEKEDLSRCEKIMLQFFYAVWTGGPQDFDFIYAARTLKEFDKKTIANWLLDPIAPWSD